MSGWGGGYVTDSVYLSGYYPQQSPRLLSLACLLGGSEGLGATLDGPLSVLELGCGQGYGAAVQAASNPHWQVTAIDYNPSHIAEARCFAAEAGLDNLRLLEADLAEDLGDAVPEADVVTLHGVWSWVPPAVRDGIVRLLRARLRPGGIVHCSYNALPAWGGALGLQRLMHDAGRQSSGGSERQAAAGLQAVLALRDAGASHLATGLAARLLPGLSDKPLAYLAHEYMNDCWSPCFLSEVARDLGRAKLTWVGSAQLAEIFPELTLTEAQRAVAARFDDPLLRELVKDMCLPRSLRQDVFVRGPRWIPPAMRDAALREVTLALVGPAGRFPYEMEVPAGKAALDRRFYEPVLAALSERPRQIGELLELPGVPRTRDNPAELAAMLIDSGFAVPVASRAGVLEPAMRLNRATAERLRRPSGPLLSCALASGALGNGVSCPAEHVMVLERIQAGELDPHAWAADFGRRMEQPQQLEFAVLLQQVAREFQPLWRCVGLL